MSTQDHEYDSRNPKCPVVEYFGPWVRVVLELFNSHEAQRPRGRNMPEITLRIPIQLEAYSLMQEFTFNHSDQGSLYIILGTPLGRKF